MLHRIFHIARRDLTLEFRERYSFLSAILYLIAITFIVYKVFGRIEPPTRIGLFWILILFTCINVVSYSFSFHGQKRKYYHYILYRSYELIIAKWLINLVKMLIAGFLLVLLQSIFADEPMKDIALFSKVYLLSIFGMTAAMTLISSISSYSQNQNTLIAIMSIPLLIPILLVGMRLSLISERIIVDTEIDNYLMMLVGIDIVYIAILIIFIPLTWKA